MHQLSFNTVPACLSHAVPYANCTTQSKPLCRVSGESRGFAEELGQGDQGGLGDGGGEEGLACRGRQVMIHEALFASA